MKKEYEQIFNIVSVLIKIITILFKYKQNNFTLNKIILLANKEYYQYSSSRTVFNKLRRVCESNILKNISDAELKYYENNINQFTYKIKNYKKINNGIKNINNINIVSNYNGFISGLEEDLFNVIKYRVNKQKNSKGQIKKDLELLNEFPKLQGFYIHELETLNRM